jgi:hypothetical protein
MRNTPRPAPMPALAGVRLFSCTLETGALTKRGECAGSGWFLNLHVHSRNGGLAAQFLGAAIRDAAQCFIDFLSAGNIRLNI